MYQPHLKICQQNIPVLINVQRLSHRDMDQVHPLCGRPHHQAVLGDIRGAALGLHRVVVLRGHGELAGDRVLDVRASGGRVHCHVFAELRKFGVAIRNIEKSEILRTDG